MHHEPLEQFRRRLLGRKYSLLERRQRISAGEQALLAEREPDWEDAAAAETAVSALESLSERERSELARIQAALERIERGTYDECAACRRPIDEERLRAVPETDRCGACASSVGPAVPSRA